MVSNYSLHRKANTELDEAINWYLQKGGKKLATHFLKDYIETKDKILSNPFLFAKVSNECRQAKFDKFPFVIIYFPTETTVLVVAIFHTSRNPDNWQSRI